MGFGFLKKKKTDFFLILKNFLFKKKEKVFVLKTLKNKKGKTFLLKRLFLFEKLHF